MKDRDERLRLGVGFVVLAGGLIGLLGAVVNDVAPAWEIVISVGLIVLGCAYVLMALKRRHDARD